ncbi:protein kinase domain-containing protein [Dokdonella sp.]|uniref:protein kinase domain-containing protein n=1 Tax=Dokdonella sp. TaxID=2291710 RepID=UPI003783C6AC
MADAARWNEIAALFDELVELPAQERVRRLDVVARSDGALAAEVRALLAADEDGNALLDADAPSAVPTLLDEGAPSDRRAGPYRLLRPLGEGGMGMVWLAERTDGAYEQQVAVKVLKRGMDTQAILRRFLQERRILARLHHPHIVRLVDGGMSSDGRPFYVMDHVDGDTITRHANTRHLDVRARIALLAQVAEAVAYAHAQLVVHRDLKPSNVLVDAAGEARVLDFGIAKLLEDSGEQTLTRTGLRVLSPAYAAPEQILGEPVGTASDVYALGLMLCELLAGELPQRRLATSPAQLAREVEGTDSERPSTLAMRRTSGQMIELYGADVEARDIVRSLAGDIDVIAAKALQRDPARRYPTAAAFADDLRRWLDGRPITARADSSAYRLAKFVQRHRLGVAAAALVVLSLLAGLGVALWQAEHARQQAQLAQQQATRAERVKGFLVAIFQQNDPAVAKGAGLSAAEVLRRGRVALDTSLAEDPQTRGELLVTIAEIQGNLGARQDASASIDQGFALLGEHVAADDPRMAHAYAVRGGLYNDSDRNPEAEHDFRAALAIMQGDPGTDPAQIEAVQSKLAYVVSVTQSAAAAVTLQRGLVERVRQRLGSDNAAVADHRVALALFLEEARDYPAAEHEYRVAIPALVRERGAVEPRACEAERNYAGLLDRLGRADEAEPLFDKTLDCYAKLYGKDSMPYARVLFSRGILLLGRRRFVEAEADLKIALDSGEGVNETAHRHRYLGRALEGQGRYAAAASEFAEAERMYREADLPNDIQRWRARADYGFMLFQTGDPLRGRAAIDAAIAGIDQVTGNADAPEIMRPLRALGEVARAQGELPTALKAHRRWSALAVKLYGADSRDAYQAAYQVGFDLVAVGDPAGFAEAAALFEHALPLAKKDHAPELAEMERAQQDLLARIDSPGGEAHARGR